MSSAVSIYIIAIVVIMLVGIFALLHYTRNAPDEKESNQVKDHVYDGIEEYDNPLPSWWLWMFYATLFFGIIYLILFPGMGSYEGVLKWSSAKQLQKEQEIAEQKYAPIYQKHFNTPIKALAEKPEVLGMGQRLFGNHCAQCHGADGGGLKGFPNLRDNDWLFGGTPEKIYETILHGRQGAMPAWESSLKKEGVEEVTNYVLGMSGRQVSKILAEKGKAKYDMFCVACHGVDGKGNMAMGAPNLTDKTWQFGGSYEDVAYSIAKGRNGVMPAHEQLLGKEKVHVIAAYVYSLSQLQ